MFDIGWTEMLVIAAVMILVVGPKDLPGMLRTIGKTIGSLRRMAGDFQRQFNDALKEADIDELKKDLAQTTSIGDPLSDINKSADDLLGSLDKDDDELPKEKFDKIQAEISEGKLKEKSATAKPATAKKTTAKKSSTKKAPVKKAPQSRSTESKPAAKKTTSKSATRKSSPRKTPAKPAAKRQATPKTKTVTGSKTA